MMPKKLYLVIVEDRHSDVEIIVHNDKEAAIEEGRSTAKSYCGDEEDYEEEDIADWLFYARYSCEGDCVSVRETYLIETDDEEKVR